MWVCRGVVSVGLWVCGEWSVRAWWWLAVGLWRWGCGFGSVEVELWVWDYGGGVVRLWV